jgi:hypothetical protein
MTKITYLEFNDPDDPESNAYEKIEKTSFKLTVEPEMYLLALIENPNKLEPDVLPAVRRLMYQAYRQGKQLNKGENE